MKLFFIVVFTAITENKKIVLKKEHITGDILLSVEEAKKLNRIAIKSAKKKISSTVNLFVAKGDETPIGI
ncbi:MAG: hypothetical protein HZA79_05030 [Sphingobacteriales bacterium]|nr:hypothetical protein [Sphingobacteriales bacterium]